MADQSTSRCYGGPDDPLMMQYHDEEWGTPLHDDRRLFELLALEGLQAGLSWRTILHKRENFRKALDNFDTVKVAGYDGQKVEEVLQDPGIVRNRAKIQAVIHNAQRFLEVQKESGSFDKYIWQFTSYQTKRLPNLDSWEKVPVFTPEAEAMSKDLKKRGFKFVGPTICYAYMQSIGMVNDHLSWCFRAPENAG